MLPLHLHVTNLMAYAELDLDFTGLDLVGLHGSNGAGKSALLESIGLALYGEHRAQNLVELIRDGAMEWRVILTFRSAGRTYRVTRAYSRKSDHLLELHEQTEDGWHPLTEGGVKATTRRIVNLLRLDYRTFASSSLLLQDQASTWVEGMSGRERKVMLQEILDLDLWAVLAAKAKARVTCIGATLMGDRKRLADLEEVAGDLDKLRARLDSIQADRLHTQERLYEEQVNLTRAEANWREVETAQAQCRDLSAQLSRVMEERTTALEEQDRRAISTRQRRERELREGHEAILSSLVAQGKAAAATEQECREREEAVRVKVAHTEAKLRGIPEVEPGRVAALEAEVAALEKQVQECEAYRASAATLRDKWQALRTERITRFSIAVANKEREKQAASRLQGDVRCIDLPRAACAFLADAKIAAERLPTLRQEVAALSNPGPEEATLDAEEKALSKRAIEHPGNVGPHVLVDLRRDLESARLAEARAAQRQDLIADLQALSVEHVALVERMLQQEETTAALRREVTAIQKNQAQERIAAVNALTLEAAEERERLENGFTARQAPIKEALTAASRHLQTCRYLPNLDTLRKAISEAQERLPALDREMGGVESRVASLEAVLGEREALEARVSTQAADLGHWETLERLCDVKGGVPKELLRTALPELEQRANAILTRLTAGRMSVEFTTEEALRSRDGEKEVLNLVVTVDGSQRAYYLLSGGQKLRVAISVRLALSALLAGRAGAQVECLILDEAFGNQSPDGRDALLQVLEVLREDFPLILVVSHSEDVTSRLPASLLVEENPTGSTIRRVA